MHWLSARRRFERARERERRGIALLRVFIHRAREDGEERGGAIADVRTAHGAELPARARGPTSGQQLERDRREREDIGGDVPRLAGNPLRRAVGTAHGRADADALQ